jgi:hypothetical protein
MNGDEIREDSGAESEDTSQRPQAELDALFQIPPEVAAGARPARIREAIKKVNLAEDRLRIILAGFLFEIDTQKYWKEYGHKSFKDFVETECDFSHRTAQELIKVHRRLVVELEVPQETLRELPWSKVALVASETDKENLDQVLDDVRTKSFQELKKQYRPAGSGSDRRVKSTSQGDALKKLAITEVVIEAIARAAQVMHCDDPQTNLEHVARWYLETREAPSVLTSRTSFN